MDEDAPVFIDDGDMAWDEPNEVDAPEAPETPEKHETPKAAYWAPEPKGNFKPKPTYGASQPSNYTPDIWRPINFDSFRSPVPAPADTCNGPLEMSISNYDAPSPTFNFFKSPVPADQTCLLSLPSGMTDGAKKEAALVALTNGSARGGKGARRGRGSQAGNYRATFGPPLRPQGS